MKSNKWVTTIVGVLVATRLLGFDLQDVLSVAESTAKAVVPWRCARASSKASSAGSMSYSSVCSIGFWTS